MEVPAAKVFSVPVLEKYGIEPVVFDDQSLLGGAAPLSRAVIPKNPLPNDGACPTDFNYSYEANGFTYPFEW